MSHATPAFTTAPAVPAPVGAAVRERWLVLGAVGLHLALGFALAAIVCVDVDEAYSLATSGQPLGEVAGRALTFELQPPFYFLALHVWRLIDGGVLWARLFSLACGAGAVWTMARAAASLAPRVRPALLAFVLAVNPLLVWAAFTARGYALIVLLASLLLVTGHRAFVADGARGRDRLAYGLLAVAALYTQYYLGFLLVGVGLLVWIAKGWRGFGAYALTMLPVALALVPLVGQALTQVHAHATTGACLDVLAALDVMVRRVELMVLPMHLVTLGRAGRWVARLLFWGAAAGSCGLALRARRDLRDWLALAAPVGTLVLFYAAAGSQGGDEIVQVRHTLALLPPALLLAFASLAAAPRPGRFVALGALVAFGLSANALWAGYHTGDRRPFHRAAVAAIEGHPGLRPEQPILVFPTDSTLSLAYHLAVSNPLVGLPVPVSLTAYDPRDFALPDEHALAGLVRAHVSPRGEAWLVTYADRTLLGVKLHPERLEAVVAREYEVTWSASFGDCRVRLIRAKGGSDGRGPL